MTTYGFNEVSCSVCGAVTKQQVLTSTNSFGSPDLDLRPPEMKRSTMSCWLQECPNCGFVSNDLGEPEKGAHEVLTTERYRAMRQAAGPSGALNSPMPEAIPPGRGSRKHGRAAEHVLWAAWAADDADDPSATEWRSKAADLFLAAASALPIGSKELMIMRTRTVDILRRAGRWEEAVDLADKILKHDIDPTIRSVVEFGRGLAQSQERSTHTVQDALSGSPADSDFILHLEQHHLAEGGLEHGPGVRNLDQVDLGEARFLEAPCGLITSYAVNTGTFPHRVVRRDHAGLHGFLSMSLINARRRNASALRLRFSQSLARRLHRDAVCCGA